MHRLDKHLPFVGGLRTAGPPLLLGLPGAVPGPHGRLRPVRTPGRGLPHTPGEKLMIFKTSEGIFVKRELEN